MPPDENDEPFLKIDLGENGGPFTFNTIADLDAWIAAEVTFLRKFQWNQIQNVYDRNINNVLNSINNNIAEIKRNPNQNQINHLRSTIKNQIESLYKNNVSIHSNSTKGKFLQSQVTMNATIATFTFTSMTSWGMGAPFPMTFYPVAGYVETILFQKGISDDRVKAVRESLDEIEKNSRAVLDEFIASHKFIEDNFSTQKSEVAKWFQDSKTDYETVKSQRIEEWEASTKKYEEEAEASIAEAKKKLDEVEKTYDEKMSLKAPVDYWEKQKKVLLARMRNIIWVIIGESVGSLILATLYFKFFIPVGDLKASIISIPIGTEVKIVGLILFVGFLIWMIRVTVRYFLGILHLEIDAGERIVMTKTYLALSREGQAFAEEDRHIILDALFRSGSTGLVHDDGGPGGLFKTLLRLVGKDK